MCLLSSVCEEGCINNTHQVVQVHRKKKPTCLQKLLCEIYFHYLILKYLWLWPRDKQFAVQETDSYERYVLT